jgi:tripartite-type tricarboxylate transporter receptor subunit TctC
VLRPITHKLQEAIVKALKAPDEVQRLAANGSTPVGSTPDQFSAQIKSEIAKWQELVREAKLVLQAG